MRRLVALALLSACAAGAPDDLAFEDTGAALLPADDLAPPPVITQAGTCPGLITFTVSSLTPGGTYRIGRSPNLGPGTPITTGPCAGTALRIGPPVILAATGTVPPSGTVSMTVTVGPLTCGHYIQAQDVASCTTSMWHQVL